jgi:hypothetical protein
MPAGATAPVANGLRSKTVFEQPVVFVIGAGASHEYNLPLGSGLKAAIASSVHFADGAGDRKLHQILALRHPGEIEKYEKAGGDLAKNISSYVSIDDALNWFARRRPEVVELGKLAIVSEILKAERASRLFSTEGWEIPNADFDDTWIPHFHSMVMESAQMDDVEAFKNVTVINFNYDRTLEHYLYAALQTKFGLDEESAGQFLSNLKVIRQKLDRCHGRRPDHSLSSESKLRTMPSCSLWRTASKRMQKGRVATV